MSAATDEEPELSGRGPEAHHHHPGDPGALRRAFLLTTVILVVEAGAGVASHSLALLSDAGHILTDVFALGLAWFAAVQAGRPADDRRTFGYHRVGILAALTNAVTLVIVVGLVAYEAIQRLAEPQPVNGALVIAAAAVAIAVNTYIALGLHRDDHGLNTRAALLHVLGDLAASVGVVVAGAVILVTGWLAADPVVSIAIVALIAWSSIRLVRDTLGILLEAVPPGLALDEVRRAIEANPQVETVHDLHVWAIAADHVALSCHVVAREGQLSDGEHLVRDLEQVLCSRFAIAHTTIQVETCHPCHLDAIHGAGAHNHPHEGIPDGVRPRNP